MANDVVKQLHMRTTVAMAIAKLIDTSAGQRTNGVVVGGALGADLANAALQPLQGHMVSGFGLGRLATL